MPAAATSGAPSRIRPSRPRNTQHSGRLTASTASVTETSNGRGQDLPRIRKTVANSTTLLKRIATTNQSTSSGAVPALTLRPTTSPTATAAGTSISGAYVNTAIRVVRSQAATWGRRGAVSCQAMPRLSITSRPGWRTRWSCTVGAL